MYRNIILSKHSKKNLKDLKKRKLYKQKEFYRSTLKSIIYDTRINEYVRYKAFLKLTKTKKNSVTFIKNRCIYTGRSRSVYRFFRISRILLKYLSSQGYLPGIQRASW